MIEGLQIPLISLTSRKIVPDDLLEWDMNDGGSPDPINISYLTDDCP